MSAQTILIEPAIEGSSYRITAQITDETHTPIPGSALTTLIISLYERDEPDSIINNVDNINILNTGRGTIDESGNLVILLTPLDNIIVNSTTAPEMHAILVEWTYAAGTKAGKHELLFTVMNL